MNNKTDKNILIAFILNFLFAIFELFGGTITNSVSIISDSVHDIADSLSIGLSYFLEKKSMQKPNDRYTYGYIRYSVIGSLITTIILIVGSILVIYNAVKRIINPETVNYNGMILFALLGVIVNFFAAYFTREGDSLNQKSVNLHMLEDILGWLITLVGAVIMKFTNFMIIDSVLSIVVALFIFKHAISNLKLILDLFLEKTPNGISINKIKESIMKINGVKDVHHIHIWSIDGYHNYATMHVVISDNNKKIKHNIKTKLKEYGIEHTTVEIEYNDELCLDIECDVNIEHHHH